MSVMSNPRVARDAVQHLLYPDILPDIVFHSAVALLAQETSQPTSVYGDAAGHWTMDVVRRVLGDRGYQCSLACSDGRWQLDSLKYLCRNPGLVGFLDASNMHAWTGPPWKTQNGTQAESPPTDGMLWAVHKKWMPLEPFYARGVPFQVGTRDEPMVKHEAEPTSCWHAVRIDYNGREKAVSRQLSKWKTPSPILMSNDDEMVLCTPSKKGWKTRALLSFECLPPDAVSQKITERLIDSYVTSIESGRVPVVHGWSSMAHAMFGLMQYFQLHVDPASFSDLTADEQKELRRYEKNMARALKHIGDE